MKKRKDLPMPTKRKGSELENHIEQVFKQLNATQGIIAIRLEVKRIGKDIYKAKQPCDYVIITSKTCWMFDAKECSEKTWYPNKAPDHQKEAMLKAQKMGHRAGFLVQFASEPMKPLSFITDFTNPVTSQDGEPWDWNWFFEK